MNQRRGLPTVCVCALGVFSHIALPSACADAGVEGPRRPAAALFADAGDLRDPAKRLRVAEEMSRNDRDRRLEADARARRRGLPLRGSLPGGGGWELVGFAGDKPLYYTTLNASAAISTGANLLWSAPYRVNGGVGSVGVWDEGAARLTHQEFGGRVTALDGAAVSHHTTHVVGTICAAGVSNSAVGMARGARVKSYDWDNDIAEMTACGASYPGEPARISISNHSYGHYVGWASTGTPAFTWFGSGSDTTAVEEDFGKYNTHAQDMDALANSLPYYLTFWAAGNDRGYTSDYNPVNGSTVALTPGGATVSYDATLHPPSDGVYRGGYDTMSYHALAKNVMSVGSVSDAVTEGLRDLSKANGNSWSSWGPSDDGRIKPDVVANGFLLYSCLANTDSSYGNITGTSMSCASASGTAQLLAHYFNVLFTNQAMRASTLKALLIHTADDRGREGPDYVYGWGLINAAAAADLLAAYRTNAGTRRVIEDRVATNRTSVSFSFTWDGASPIRATLCWTDPAGEAADEHDSRAARLVNNLDLRVIGPAGTVCQPWVMPFVGDWTTNALALPATTGSNTTDNIEQVLVASPGASGTYTARVTFGGTLASGSQPFSLILSGVAGSSSAPAPLLTASTPVSGAGTNLLTLAGDRFMLGAVVRLWRSGLADVAGANVEVLGDAVNARFDTAGMASGWWNMTLTNPDGQQAVLYRAVAVPSPATVLMVR